MIHFQIVKSTQSPWIHWGYRGQHQWHFN